MSCPNGWLILFFVKRGFFRNASGTPNFKKYNQAIF